MTSTTTPARRGKGRGKGRMAAPGLSVVYIVLEDFRGLSMSALCGSSSAKLPGRPCAATPHLDALAREGVLFERAYAQSPICNPSRTSTMTGRYPSATGVLHNDAGTGRQLPTLPVLLQRSKRGRIVTQSPYSKVFHLPAGDAQRIQQPWDRGWWNATNWRAVPAETLPWLGRSSPAPKRVMRGPGYGHVAPDVFHHMSFKRTMAMLGALLSQPKPFFFGAGISGTHTPLVPPLSFVKRHDESSIQLPAQHAPHGPQLARKDGFQSTTLSASQQREYIATYLAAAEYVDAQVGAVLSLLKRAEGGGGGGSGGSGGVLRSREVAVVVHADHGFHLGEHGRWSKYTLYEEAVHVPLILKVPRGLANVRRPQLVELVDVLPTLLSLWGVPAAQRPHLDGWSLLPLAGFQEASDGSFTPLGGGGGGGGGGAVPAGYRSRSLVRSAMRHPMRIEQPAAAAATSADVRGGGEWVCGEQHYVRTADAALTTYLHNGRVVNTSMFNLASDPLEQRNLIQHSQAEWPYSTLRNWARLVAAEREAWPREEVQARDESASRTGEPCSEQHTRRRARMKRWRARQRRLREKRQMAVSQ